MFNSESIPCVTTRRVDRHNVGMVHITLQTLLNSTRKSDGKKFSHAELARALNVSEQVVTNWSKRGVSVEGALAAQYAFGQDANFILGRVSHPMVLPRPAPGSEAVHRVQEPTVSYLQEPQQDPVTKEVLDLFGNLDPPSRREWLADLRGFVRGRRPHSDGDASAMAG